MENGNVGISTEAICSCPKVSKVPHKPPAFYKAVIENCYECQDEIYVSEVTRESRETLKKNNKGFRTLCLECSEKVLRAREAK